MSRHECKSSIPVEEVQFAIEFLEGNKPARETLIQTTTSRITGSIMRLKTIRKFDTIGIGKLLGVQHFRASLDSYSLSMNV
jgi:hypothetical protein